MGLVAISTLTTNQSNVNASDLNGLATPIQTEFNGNIENVNIKSSAAIAISKIALTGAILNTHVNASAAIDGSKISPDFGAQNIVTTGNIDLGGDIDVDGTLETDAITLNGAAINEASGICTLNASAIVKGIRYGTAVDKKASYGAQQVTADSLVVGYSINSADTGTATCYADTNSNPTTVRQASYSYGTGMYQTFCFPVKKSEYWKIVLANSTMTQCWVYPQGD